MECAQTGVKMPPELIGHRQLVDRADRLSIAASHSHHLRGNGLGLLRGLKVLQEEGERRLIDGFVHEQILR